MKMKHGFRLKMVLTLAFFVLLISFSSCISIPGDWEDYGGYYDEPIRIILKVDPDDAQVMLNGKWIGDAYEFSTKESALRLHSRRNELVIKRPGYYEEEINLYNYSSDRVTVRIKLRPDRNYRESMREDRPGILKSKPFDAEKNAPPAKPLPPSKTNVEAKPPLEPKDEPSEAEIQTVEVSLQILPEESSIYINGKFWGISPEGGNINNIRMKPGKYSIEVTKPGYKAVRKEMVLTDKKNSITIILEKQV